MTWIVVIYFYKTITEHNLDGKCGHVSKYGNLFCIFPIFTSLFEFQCFSYTENENSQTGLAYNYTICPFEQITQSRSSGNSSDPWEINLGSWNGKMHFIEKHRMQCECQNYYPLTMHFNNGSTEFCTDENTSFARKTKVIYTCEASNRIVDVYEMKKCIYAIRFSVDC